MIEPQTRRRFLVGAGAVVAGGGFALLRGTKKTKAAVAMDSFSVEDATYAAEAGEMYSPYLQIDTAWEYEGVENAAEGMVALLVDGGIVDTTTLSDVAAPADSGTTALEGPIVKTIDWDEKDWTPPDDGEVSHEIVIEIRFEVRDATAETIAKAKAKTTTPITVTDAGPGWNATIGGTGDVYFQQTTEGPLETPTNTSE